MTFAHYYQCDRCGAIGEPRGMDELPPEGWQARILALVGRPEAPGPYKTSGDLCPSCVAEYDEAITAVQLVRKSLPTLRAITPAILEPIAPALTDSPYRQRCESCTSFVVGGEVDRCRGNPEVCTHNL